MRKQIHPSFHSESKKLINKTQLCKISSFFADAQNLSFWETNFVSAKTLAQKCEKYVFYNVYQARPVKYSNDSILNTIERSKMFKTFMIYFHVYPFRSSVKTPINMNNFSSGKIKQQRNKTKYL